MRIVWDSVKAKRNLAKHGITFEEAGSVLEIGLTITIADSVHSVTEEREQTIGLSDRSRVLVVIHTELRDGDLRIISARRATNAETNDYAEELLHRQRH